jgi:hypothetical protein
MIGLPAGTRVWLAASVTDPRKGLLRGIDEDVSEILEYVPEHFKALRLAMRCPAESSGAGGRLGATSCRRGNNVKTYTLEPLQSQGQPWRS